jgi:hypothetical protein
MVWSLSAEFVVFGGRVGSEIYSSRVSISAYFPIHSTVPFGLPGPGGHCVNNALSGIVERMISDDNRYPAVSPVYIRSSEKCKSSVSETIQPALYIPDEITSCSGFSDKGPTNLAY